MEKMMNTYEQEAPTYCAKGCGFFGTAATMNMCSKCYRDHILKEAEAKSVAVKAAVEKPLSSKSLSKKDSESVESKPKSDESATKEVERSSKKEVKRCMCCNKKFQVLGFKCRCGSTFCGSHRYPEQHNCTYDFKVVGKAVITKENPLVVADKLQKI